MFVSNGNYIFRGVEERTSNKTGNIYRIVKIADADNYQQLEFFPSENFTVDCSENSKCKLVLEATRNGYSTSMNCLSVSAL
ncbi:hypothetical protein IGJ94_001401 [Enterococcus sp. AZ153]|uniref:hypothetical protein n=1 Tax=unclassified Enterococcus TaxID=2608891 RepID=UPI003E1682F2